MIGYYRLRLFPVFFGSASRVASSIQLCLWFSASLTASPCRRNTLSILATNADMQWNSSLPFQLMTLLTKQMSRARYIQSKVNPILENLVTEVLLERPDNPVPNLKVRCGAMLKQCSGVNNCPVQILAEVSLDIIKLSWFTVKACKRMRSNATCNRTINESEHGNCIQTHTLTITCTREMNAGGGTETCPSCRLAWSRNRR